ncbi:histidine kinase [Dictyobacter kobayashii]|uniref:histidine kinase n=1 Tax=Dictyobacter kobayashii TaxID=2014872 RepID=UPI00248216EF|nr:histidine kinase [Dictyobacter kobayashii]
MARPPGEGKRIHRTDLTRCILAETDEQAGHQSPDGHMPSSLERRRHMVSLAPWKPSESVSPQLLTWDANQKPQRSKRGTAADCARGSSLDPRAQSARVHLIYLVANVDRRCLLLTTTTTPSRRSPQTPCSTFIHTGKRPGSMMMVTMATNMITETIRRRRYPLPEPRAIWTTKRVVSKALAATMVPRIQTAGVTIYGAWLLIYHIGRRRSHPWWLLALFCLACASLLIPLPSTNVYWLPILPTTTACLMTATRSRLPGALAAGALWLSTSLALSLLTRQWYIGGQVILLISFCSTCGCAATIRELALAHTQLQAYSAQVEELSVIRERNRIAREIHDTLGHALTLLAVQLETATQLEARGDPRLLWLRAAGYGRARGAPGWDAAGWP